MPRLASHCSSSSVLCTPICHMLGCAALCGGAVLEVTPVALAAFPANAALYVGVEAYASLWRKEQQEGIA
jgi:hypothetical protein